MGFWSFLVGKSIRVEDNNFGALLLMDGQDPATNYFEGRRFFRPAGTVIDVLIDGTLPGPTIEQNAFYEQLENWYTRLVPTFQLWLAASLRDWQPLAVVGDFTREFWPVGVSIPHLSQQTEPEWDISFETTHDKNHMFTLSMRGWEPYDVCIDG